MIAKISGAMAAEGNELGLFAWLRSIGFGEPAAVIDLAISVPGFLLTVWGVYRAGRIAREARDAAREAREHVKLIENVVDFSAAIATLEEIKRLHRRGDAWQILPDRYANIRKRLIELRGSGTHLTEGQMITIQSALTNLAQMEDQVEKHLQNQATLLKPSTFNKLLSGDIDGLVAVLVELKKQSSEDAG